MIPAERMISGRAADQHFALSVGIDVAQPQAQVASGICGDQRLGGGRQARQQRLVRHPCAVAPPPGGTLRLVQRKQHGAAIQDLLHKTIGEQDFLLSRVTHVRA